MQNNLCETRTDVKSFAGHVYLPSGTADLGQGQEYPINSVPIPADSFLRAQ
jgi:hypothetical protein